MQVGLRWVGNDGAHAFFGTTAYEGFGVDLIMNVADFIFDREKPNLRRLIMAAPEIQDRNTHPAMTA
jgi:hypothetical protein